MIPAATAATTNVNFIDTVNINVTASTSSTASYSPVSTFPPLPLFSLYSSLSHSSLLEQPPRCHHHRPRQTEFDPAPRARTYLITAADPPDRSSSSPASSSGELSPPYPAQVYFLPARHPSPAADDAVLAKVLPRPPDFADAVETPACEPMDVDGPEFSAAVEEYNRAVSTSIPCSSSQKPGQVHVPVPDEHARMLADMDAAIDSDVARVLSLNSDTFDDVYQRERLSPLAAEREEQQNVDADEIGDLSIFGIGRLTTAFKAWNLSVSTTSPVDAEQESESEREITTATEEEKEELTSAEGATRVESMDTDGDVVMTDAVF
ncbi:hypothetical protein BZA70DRAFT_89071 [Myxozyma melibiosi]|uniref:Uncharacterized protein n=1 Tax=Myxozyma melibiosi TaxID=54550 RepID=A0ABR1EZF0_9ASCO